MSLASSGRRLGNEELQMMGLFENITKVPPKDCVVDTQYNRLIFVVDKGLAGLAVGKNGSKIRMLRDVFKRDVEVVEDGETIEELAKSTLYPAKIVQVEVKEEGGRKIIVARVAPGQLGIAIGRQGRNAYRAKLLLSRYFGISDLRVVEFNPGLAEPRNQP
ncbi:MAG: NusA-like transcription termination signal-binding factor [Infirmifilum sp.]